MNRLVTRTDPELEHSLQREPAAIRFLEARMRGEDGVLPLEPSSAHACLTVGIAKRAVVDLFCEGAQYGLRIRQADTADETEARSLRATSLFASSAVCLNPTKPESVNEQYERERLDPTESG